MGTFVIGFCQISSFLYNHDNSDDELGDIDSHIAWSILQLSRLKCPKLRGVKPKLEMVELVCVSKSPQAWARYLGSLSCIKHVIQIKRTCMDVDRISVGTECMSERFNVVWNKGK